jgi:16S rRNA (guanine527-N7)-methyltransferase
LFYYELCDKLKFDMYSLLEEGLLKLGFGCKNSIGRILSQLTRYIEEIELFNPAYGLVKVKDRRELIVRHILDSLAPAGIINKIAAGTVADVGSGTGLPGIPLAICMPDLKFTLIERMGRRAGFLCNVLAVLGLPNAVVEENDMETLARHLPEKDRFHLIVFRAFRPLNPLLLKGLFALLLPGGKIAAYKGRRQSIEEEMAGLLPDREIIPLEVPFLDEERHLLLIHSPAR